MKREFNLIKQLNQDTFSLLGHFFVGQYSYGGDRHKQLSRTLVRTLHRAYRYPVCRIKLIYLTSTRIFV